MRPYASLLLAVLSVAPPQALAQSPYGGPAFEVASVKPAHGGLVSVQADPGRLTINDESLEVLIRLAYGLREYEYSGPPWLHTARYDIVATTASPQPRAVVLQMLQHLLADRFKLTFHRETRTLPVYALVVGKSGPKLKPADESLPVPFELYSNFHMEPIPDGTVALRGYGSLGQLCDFLSREVERPVVDRTGITGNFDFRLLCAVEGFPGYDTSPSVFSALQTQMGLKLEADTSPIERTVIDRVEQPSGN
jgi:uncharacterized protein (TIGR03435 family)